MNKTAAHEQNDICDVAIVGYGPVGQIMALLLGQQGRSVKVFERWTERYPLPRAVCVDHEIYRMLSAIGMRDRLPAVTHAAPVYRWFNSEWQELLAIDWSTESLSGGPQVNFVHQPTLEELFDEQVSTQQSVEINLGYEVTNVAQTDDYATLGVKHCESGETHDVKARFIIGADGANSRVRQAIGGEMDDRGFEADWLVIDILPNKDADLDIPPAAQWCNPERPTTIVPAGIRNGRYYRRWEFMRLPHETIQDIENEDKAWELLSPWVTPDQATMVRHKIYTFRSLLARQWRQRRLLIAGDAAHVMPPFMGQGMCTGLRDDWNLAWKLGLVLDGKVDEAILDSYQTERYPHASDIIDMSMYLGRIICQPDHAKASERDRQFLEGSAPPMPSFPSLTRGLLQKSDHDGSASVVGELSPHGEAVYRDERRWLDDCVGAGHFTLIVQDVAAANSLSKQAEAVLHRFNIAVITLEDSHAVDEMHDLDAKYRVFLEAHGVIALLIRPDFYVFGGASSTEELESLINAFGSALPAGSSTADRGLEQAL